MKYVFLFATLLLTFVSKGSAHSDYSMKMQHGKVIVDLETGFEEYEVNKVGNFLGYLCDKFIEEGGYLNGQHVVIKLLHDYMLGLDTTLYYLSVGYWQEDSFVVADNGRVSMRYSPHKGEEVINISVYSNSFKLAPLLKLIDYALSDPVSVKKKQIMVDLPKEFDPVKKIVSVPVSQVAKTLGASSSGVDSFSRPVYRDITPAKGFQFDYLYKGDKYCFVSPYAKHRPSKVYGSLSNVKQIVKVGKRWYLVFETDTTFYWVPNTLDTLIGPYGVNSSIASGRPIKKHQYEYHPFRILLYFNGRYDSQMDHLSYYKVAFLPEYDTVIENYQETEREVFGQMVELKGSDTITYGKFYYQPSSVSFEEKTASSCAVNLLFLLVGIGLGGFLLRKRKGKK